jgi:hypothetical protein
MDKRKKHPGIFIKHIPNPHLFRHEIMNKHVLKFRYVTVYFLICNEQHCNAANVSHPNISVVQW